LQNLFKDVVNALGTTKPPRRAHQGAPVRTGAPFVASKDARRGPADHQAEVRMSSR
jgi:hypothetical protein